MSKAHTNQNQNDRTKGISLQEFRATVPQMEKLLLETETWTAGKIDLVKARRKLCKPAFIILKGQVTHGRDYERTPALNKWLEYCRVNPQIFLEQNLELDLSEFLHEAYQKTYRASGVTISQDAVATAPSGATDANERSRADVGNQGDPTDLTPLVNPVLKASGEKGSKIKTTGGTTKSGATESAPSNAAVVNVPRVSTPTNAPEHGGAANAPQTPTIVKVAVSGKLESVGDDEDAEGSNEGMDLDDSTGQGDTYEDKGGQMDVELLTETDAEGETEVSETEATEVSETEATEVSETEATEVSETEATEEEGGVDGGDDDGDLEGGPDKEASETEDGADPFTGGFSTNERDRAGIIEKRAQDFEEGYDRQEQKRRKLYKSLKKNIKEPCGIIRGLPGMEVHSPKCELCMEKPAQLCFKQDPTSLKHVALCCYPCRKKGKGCSFNVARGKTAQVDDSGDDDKRATEEAEETGPQNTERVVLAQNSDVSSRDEGDDSDSVGTRRITTGDRVMGGSKQMTTTKGNRERAKSKVGEREHVPRTKKGGKVDGGCHEPMSSDGAGNEMGATSLGGGRKEKHVQTRVKAEVDDPKRDIATQESDVDNGVENGNRARGSSKKGKAQGVRSLQPEGTPTRSVSRPKINPPSNPETSEALDGVPASSRTKRVQSNKVPVGGGLNGNGTERRSTQGAGKSARTAGSSTIARGKRPELASVANEMEGDGRPRAAETTFTFRRVAPAGVDEDETPRALGRLTDDHVRLEQRVTMVDSTLRVSNRQIGELEERLAVTNGEIAGLTTAHSQDRGLYHDQVRTLEEKIDKQQDSLRISNAFIETVSQRVNTLEAHHNTRLSVIKGQRPTTLTAPTLAPAEASAGVPDIIERLEQMLRSHRIDVQADINAAISGLEARMEKLLAAAIGHSGTSTQAVVPLPSVPHNGASASVAAGISWNDNQHHPQPIAPGGTSASAPLQGPSQVQDFHSLSSARTTGGVFPNPPLSGSIAHTRGNAVANLGPHGARRVANPSQLGHRQAHQTAGHRTTAVSAQPSLGAPDLVPNPNQPLPHSTPAPYHHNNRTSVQSCRNPGPQDLQAPSMFVAHPQSNSGVLPAGDDPAPITSCQGDAPTQLGYTQALSGIRQQHQFDAKDVPTGIYDAPPITFSDAHGGLVQSGHNLAQGVLPYPPPSTGRPSNGEDQGVEGVEAQNAGSLVDSSYNDFGGIPPGGMTAYLQAPLPEHDSSISRRSGSRSGSHRQGGSTLIPPTAALSYASAISRGTNEALFGSAPPRPSALTSVGGISVGWSHPGSPLTEAPSSNMGSVGPSNASNN